MFVLTAPQAAATLAVTLIGFEIGLFGTTLVNAVLVLILVSIAVAALLAEKVIAWVPGGAMRKRPLGSRVVVVSPSTGPTDAAVRVATMLARPDGGQSDVVITGTETELPPDPSVVRRVEQRLFRHGFDGHLRTEINSLPDAVTKTALTARPSLLVVDDPDFDVAPGRVPVLVVHGATAAPDAVRLIADGDGTEGIDAEITRKLSKQSRGRFASGAAPARP
jgi:hypothetical protein